MSLRTHCDCPGSQIVCSRMLAQLVNNK